MLVRPVAAATPSCSNPQSYRCAVRIPQISSPNDVSRAAVAANDGATRSEFMAATLTTGTSARGELRTKSVDSSLRDVLGSAVHSAPYPRTVHVAAIAYLRSRDGICPRLGTWSTSAAIGNGMVRAVADRNPAAASAIRVR